MKDKSPSSWTRFLDSESGDTGAFPWESDPDARREWQAWQAIRAELSEALRPPPLEHGEFINARVMEVIGREDVRPAGSSGWVWRLALGLLSAAVVLSLVFVPDVLRPGGSSGFASQVIAVRAVHPHISVATFHLPDESGVVVWLEGAPYIPEGDQLR
ncbi:MAG: hypothetical protein Fur0032_17380 [Terrimicrobiaceae bacterium]